MVHLQDYKFGKVIKDLFSCTDELQAQLAQTREQCQQIEEVMRAIRNNRLAAKNYVLPRCPYGRDQAAND
ncbi:MAG: hypothetical protein RPR40_02510 [Bermanella sp.]